MEQKNIQIIFFMTMLFCYKFVQAHPEAPNAIKNPKKCFKNWELVLVPYKDFLSWIKEWVNA